MSRANEVVIVGGGPAGFAAARAYREAGGSGHVSMLSADPHAPYRRPPLSKEMLRGELDPDELPLAPPGWYDENEVALRHLTVSSLDVERRLVVTERGDELLWDACVLATGSEPMRLPVPGGEDKRLLVLRTRDDAERLATLVAAGTAVAVVGTGFIGCEAAVSLTRRGADVTVIGQEPQPQAQRLGEDVGARLAGWLREAGAELVLGAEVQSIQRHDDEDFCIALGGHPAVEADVVLLATGARPRLELAERAGLEIADAGGVAADAGLATSAEGVFAAGDIACPEHPVAGRRLRVEHWGDALAHGEVVGRRLAGDEQARWSELPGFWSTIGEHTIKYAAWGDGWDDVRVRDHPGGGWTAWYGRGGTTVGVLCHDRDEDYDAGRERLVRAESLP